MHKYPLTEIIARREYTFAGPNGPVSVGVSIGAPAPVPGSPHGEWYCPYVVAGPDRERGLDAIGIDGVQALLMALSGLRADLEFIAAKGRLTFFDGTDLGIALVGGAA